MCECHVDVGGGDVLPTELNHLTRKEAAETELEAAAAVSSPQLVASAHSVNNRLVGVKRMMRVMSWCYTTVPTVPTEMKGDVEGGTNGAE